MGYENLLYEVKEQIARITINRPNVLNALNRKTVEELGQSLDAARQDDSVRVVILTGAGEKAFVAGADINALPLTARTSRASARKFFIASKPWESRRLPRSTVLRLAAAVNSRSLAPCASPARTQSSVNPK
jgi:enoyl-CoA hydratase/carnithine racemase